MKNNLFVWSILLLLLSFTSCKKEDSTIDRNSIRLVMVTPVEALDTASQQYHFTIRGAVLGPASIDLKDHGFLVKTNGSTGSDVVLSVGSAKKTGNVQAEYSSYNSLNQLTFVMYAVLASGEVITSDGSSVSSTTTPSGPFPVQIAPSGVSSATVGYETFVSDIFNNDVANYLVIEQGIEYALGSSYATNPVYTNQLQGPVVNSNAYQTPVNMQFQSSVYFQPSTFYNYRIYAVAKNINTNVTTRIYAYDNSFTSQP